MAWMNIAPAEIRDYWRSAALAGDPEAMTNDAVGNAFRLDDVIDVLDELKAYEAEAVTIARRERRRAMGVLCLALAAAYSRGLA